MGLVQVIIEHIGSGFTEIVANLGALFMLAWTITLADKALLGFDGTSRSAQKLIVGFIFGLAAVIGLGIPVKLEPGILAGAEGIPLFFSGYLSGPLAAVICSVMAITWRITIGGEGMPAGLISIGVFTVLGVYSFYLRAKWSDCQKWHWLVPVFMVLMGTVLSSLGVLTLPQSKQFAALWVIWPNLLLANGLGSFLLIKLLQRERAIRRIENREERAKAERDQRIQTMIKNSPGMVYQYLMKVNGDHFAKFVSEQGLRIYEISRDDFKKNPQIFTEMVHSEDQPSIAEAILLSAHSLERFEWEGRIQTAKGNIKWIKARSVPQKLSNGDILWDGLLLDITKEKALQKDLEQQRGLSAHRDKLASIGELAAGVGHEINNPLAVVLGNLELVLTKKENLSAKTRQRLQSATKAGQRILTIVRGLKSFSRADETDSFIFGAEIMLVELQSLVKEIYRNQGINICFDIDLPEGSKLEGSPGKIQQALMNLLSNAKDATEGQEQRNITLTARAEGELFKVHVSDNGPGLPSESQSRIFEAFYTTKKSGKGTGLGLSLSQRFISECNGELKLENSSAEGCTFSISIPLSKKHLSLLPSPTVNSGPLRRQDPDQRLTALIVEDVPEMRLVLEEMLRTENIDIESVENGLIAYHTVREKPEKFDLVITDVNMPEMSGPELLENLRKQQLGSLPKFIFVTGGGQHSLEKNKTSSNEAVLMKPFARDELIFTMNKLLSDEPHKRQPYIERSPTLH